MVVMNDDLWFKIVDNLYGSDEVLTQRMDNEVHSISNAEAQYVMEMLVDQKDELEDQIAKISMQKVQDRHMVGVLRDYVKTCSNVWLALNNSKED